MADCEERLPHEDIFRKLEKVFLDTIETGDLETGHSISFDPTPEMMAAIRAALVDFGLQAAEAGR